jgi:23S rRNA pseudouridine2605 synthase
MDERLQKIMAQAGLGSRRDCEEYIQAGRVRVNGAVAVIGQKADPAVDTVTLDGRVIKPAEQKIYIALNKPRYVLSTVETEQGDSRQTVRDLIPITERLYPVGRLDFESEGLVLMTNDGDLAQKLTHPSHGHSKEYRVLLARHPDEEQLSTWKRGVVLEDGYKTQPAEIRTESLAGKGAWVRIVMREGRKRQIREIGAILGLPVVRILRVRIGNLLLGALKPGEWRYLTSTEIVALKDDRPGLPPFPDMTRKKPLDGRKKPVRRLPTKPPSARAGGKAEQAGSAGPRETSRPRSRGGPIHLGKPEPREQPEPRRKSVQPGRAEPKARPEPRRKPVQSGKPESQDRPAEPRRKPVQQGKPEPRDRPEPRTRTVPAQRSRPESQGSPAPRTHTRPAGARKPVARKPR